MLNFPCIENCKFNNYIFLIASHSLLVDLFLYIGTAISYFKEIEQFLMQKFVLYLYHYAINSIKILLRSAFIIVHGSWFVLVMISTRLHVLSNENVYSNS